MILGPDLIVLTLEDAEKLRAMVSGGKRLKALRATFEDLKRRNLMETYYELDRVINEMRRRQE